MEELVEAIIILIGKLKVVLQGLNDLIPKVIRRIVQDVDEVARQCSSAAFLTSFWWWINVCFCFITCCSFVYLLFCLWFIFGSITNMFFYCCRVFSWFTQRNIIACWICWCFSFLFFINILLRSFIALSSILCLWWRFFFFWHVNLAPPRFEKGILLAISSRKNTQLILVHFSHLEDFSKTQSYNSESHEIFSTRFTKWHSIMKQRQVYFVSD